MSTYKERFQNLVRVLDLHIEASRKGELATINGFVKSVKFDIHTWVSTDCGTAACAIGSCMLDPWFKKQGFVSDDDNLGEDSYPVYGMFRSWSSVISFFDFDDINEAKWLFSHEAYKQPTAYNVKRRVLSFMKKKGYL